MQIFSVTLAERRVRQMRVAAPSREAALEALQATAREGDTVQDIRLWSPRNRGAGLAALHHLLGRDYLPLPGVGLNPTVQDWVEYTANTDLAAGNETLALIGLRVLEEPDRLLVGSPASVPGLAALMRGTSWTGTDLLPTLMALDGAERSNCTFAGRRARAVALPLRLVLAGVGGAA